MQNIEMILLTLHRVKAETLVLLKSTELLLTVLGNLFILLHSGFFSFCLALFGKSVELMQSPLKNVKKCQGVLCFSLTKDPAVVISPSFKHWWWKRFQTQ